MSPSHGHTRGPEFYSLSLYSPHIHIFHILFEVGQDRREGEVEIPTDYYEGAGMLHF